MVILKLGGSVITVKNEPMKSDCRNIKRLSEEISTARQPDLVIVHGGGSFGHPIAEKYGIAEGYVSNQQVLGFSKTHQSMTKLNSFIIEALLDLAVPAVSVAPSSFIIADKGRICKSDFTVVKRLIGWGIVPVLYGDVVLDKTKGFSILSGDQLAVRLAIELNASRLVFGVDVDGVHTSNPKLVPSSKLIERLSLEKLKGIVEIGKALTTDVTGGMLGKVNEVALAVESGIEVLIVNATKPDIILKALRGEQVKGTILQR
jgi:isopentenyl phosphate kinase